MASLQGYVDRRIFLVLQDGRAIVVCLFVFPASYLTACTGENGRL